MGEKKYYVPDKDFYLKMRGAATTLMERGTCIILEHTGMHPSSLASLERSNLRHEGDHWFIYWIAPKPQRTIRHLRAPIPQRDLKIVQDWINTCSGRSRHWYKQIIREIGERADYIDTPISPMTYRAQRIVYLMDRLGSIRQVAQLTGASYQTIEHHYAQANPVLYEVDTI